MELVQGKSLIEKVRKGPLAENELVRVAFQLLDGLCAAHPEGIIHRDLKPGNLRIGTACSWSYRAGTQSLARTVA